MKISLKELLRLEKYLNGLGRRINRINRINRFGMESEIQVPIEHIDVDSEDNLNKKQLITLKNKLYGLQQSSSTSTRKIKPRMIIVRFINPEGIKKNIRTYDTVLTYVITRWEDYTPITYDGFLSILIKQTEDTISNINRQQQKERPLKNEDQPREPTRKTPKTPEQRQAEKDAAKILLERQQNVNRLISDHVNSLLKIEDDKEFCSEWEKYLKRNKYFRADDNYEEDRTNLLDNSSNTNLIYSNLVYKQISGWTKINEACNNRYKKVCPDESQVEMDTGENVGPSSSSQQPLQHNLVSQQPPFGPNLVGEWVYHPKNDYSQFSDYIGLVEKHGTLTENGKDVDNITIIWIPSSADYQNIGKKNICADIDNPENCNATNTGNCEWKEATARSKGKCVVRDEVNCKDYKNKSECNDKDTCNWNGKRCTKKTVVDNIDNFLKYNYIIDDLNEEEYLKKGIQVIEKPTYEGIDTITIIVDQDNDGIYLKLLAQLDAIKDFYGSGGSDYHNFQQLKILRNYIRGIIHNIPRRTSNLNLIDLLERFTESAEKSQDRNRKIVMNEIYVELENKLGIQSYTLEGITDMLFPTGTSSRLKNKKEQIERFVLYHLNNEKLANHLKDISDIYKVEESDEEKNIFIETSMNPENYMEGLDEMIVWVEGSANRNNISTLVPMLRFNGINKVSPRSFATYIDAAAKTNILTDSIGYFDVNTIDIDQPQVRYEIKTNSGDLLISFRIKRIGTQDSTNNPLYVVEIDNFFGLDCTDVGPLAYIGPNISISGVWDRIKMLLFNTNTNEKLIDNLERNTQVDLCMKANKTLMDMLKGIITMEYKKSQAGKNTVIFSVFPDLNGARFMATNSSEGVTLHTVSSSSPRIFLKKRIFDIIFQKKEGGVGFGKKKMNEIDYLIKLVKSM